MSAQVSLNVHKTSVSFETWKIAQTTAQNSLSSVLNRQVFPEKKTNLGIAACKYFEFDTNSGKLYAISATEKKDRVEVCQTAIWIVLDVWPRPVGLWVNRTKRNTVLQEINDPRSNTVLQCSAST